MKDEAEDLFGFCNPLLASKNDHWEDNTLFHVPFSFNESGRELSELV